MNWNLTLAVHFARTIFILSFLLAGMSYTAHAQNFVRFEPTETTIHDPDRITALAPTAETLNFDPNGSSALIGSGYRTAEAKIAGDCVQRGGLDTISGNGGGGQAVSFQLTQISSMRDFRRVMNLSASASLSIGIYSGSGSLSIFENDQISNMSSHFIVDVHVTNQTSTLKSKKLTESAKNKMKKGKGPFKDYCGTEFVTGYISGGIFQAIVTLEANSEQHQKDVNAAVSAGISGVMSGSASFSEFISNVSKYAKVTFNVIRKGSDDPIPDVNKLAQYAMDFPKKVEPNHGKPWVFEVITSDYRNVEDFDNNSLPDNDIYQQAFIEQLAASRDVLLPLRNDVIFALNHPDQFPNLSHDSLMELQDKANKALQTIQNLANDCLADPSKNCNKNIPDIPSNLRIKRGPVTFARLISDGRLSYSLRGNQSIVDKAIENLSKADWSSAPLSERYEASLLISQLALWRAMDGDQIYESNNLPDRHRSDAYGTFVIEAYKALALSSLFPQELGRPVPCEGRYLVETDRFISAENLRNKDDAKAVELYKELISNLENLRNISTLQNTSCVTFHGGGIHRLIGRAQYRISDALRKTGDSAHYWQQSKLELSKAYAAEPMLPANVTWYIYALEAILAGDRISAETAKACSILHDFKSNPIPNHLAGINDQIVDARKNLENVMGKQCS